MQNRPAKNLCAVKLKQSGLYKLPEDLKPYVESGGSLYILDVKPNHQVTLAANGDKNFTAVVDASDIWPGMWQPMVELGGGKYGQKQIFRYEHNVLTLELTTPFHSGSWRLMANLNDPPLRREIKADFANIDALDWEQAQSVALIAAILWLQGLHESTEGLLNAIQKAT